MSKKRKQKIKIESNGQKGLKRCKTCNTLLNPFSNEDFCSDECKKHFNTPEISDKQREKLHNGVKHALGVNNE